MPPEQKPLDERADTPAEADTEVQRIVEAADKLGVEVDEAEATQWITAMKSSETGAFRVDKDAGIYGHRVTLLDFDQAELTRYRRLAAIVELPDRPGLQTAIALSGSAAQCRVQRYPGDADFFERVHIQAPTRQEACRLLGQAMREKALAFLKGPNYELVDVRWGSYLSEVLHDGKRQQIGASIDWPAAAVVAGEFQVLTADGQPLTIDWAYGEYDPGWCKIDWIISEPEYNRVVSVSNMLDVTWEAPDGRIVPLDGFIDPYYQEVYLDAESIPLFNKLIDQLSPVCLQDYVGQLEGEVRKYAHHAPPNYGKVAKRLYNIFRLTGRWEEAAFIRELFDEPAAHLYQVCALLDTLDEALTLKADLDTHLLARQIDDLIRTVIRITDGPLEERIVTALLRLRDSVTGWEDLGDARSGLLMASKGDAGDLVNEYFEIRLMAMPNVAAYVEELGTEDTDDAH
ncbi:MAG: hypothetical protein KKA73_04960 [Chloroflexi bacterium]|nr:hypothetical protein [Chloroflexota bacterium]MBU1747017.1 hypothetical protein [Chloroflexota bacterium]MBU1880312.1 hypothetical protein [Chloroflexota bacterium]